jgi:cysteine desulfurase
MAFRYYFDWAATAPPETPEETPRVPFGNPSSRHEEGRRARETLEEARSRCASVLRVRPDQIYFSSGASESNALVLFSLLTKDRRPSGGAELLCTAGEHPSILANLGPLERLGLKSAVAALNSRGAVDAGALEGALEKNPALRMAAITGVNNETGAVNDLAALTDLLHKKPGLHVHSDLVQAAGKIPLDIAAWKIDSASFSGHKLGGPRGIGLLYLRRPLVPLIRGGGQEGGIRPGTENAAGALALARRLETRADPAALETSLGRARERMGALISLLASKLPDCFSVLPANRDDEKFSPWILQARFRGIPGEVLVRALDQRGFAISTGSACSSAKLKRPVLEAMGLDEEARLEGVRISQGWSTTMEEIKALAEVLAKIPGEL